jgi:hypothetical protein
MSQLKTRGSRKASSPSPSAPQSSEPELSSLPEWLQAALLLRRSGVLRIEYGDDGRPCVIDFGPPQFMLPPPRTALSGAAPAPVSDDPMDRHLNTVEKLRQQVEQHDRLMYAAVE